MMGGGGAKVGKACVGFLEKSGVKNPEEGIRCLCSVCVCVSAGMWMDRRTSGAVSSDPFSLLHPFLSFVSLDHPEGQGTLTEFPASSPECHPGWEMPWADC